MIWLDGMCGKYFSEMITAEKWFPFSSANFPLLFLLRFFILKNDEKKMSGIKITHRNFWNSFFRFAFLKTGFLIFENLRLGIWIFVKQKFFRLIQNFEIEFFKKCECRKMVSFFFCKFSASLSSWFFILKMEKKIGG